MRDHALRDDHGRKYCSSCGLWTEVTAFNKHPATVDRLQIHCRDCKKAVLRQWRLDNPDRARLHRESPEVRRARERAAYARAYALDPAPWLARSHRRRARRRGGGGAYTAAAWHAVCTSLGSRCLACGTTGPLTVDHVVPLLHGGSNDVSNLQPLCETCNKAKGSRSIDYRPSL